MPAVHSRNWIGLHGKSQILMHAAVGPPDALRVGVARFVRLHALFAPPHPPRTVASEVDRRHDLPRAVLDLLPSRHVKTARHDSGANAFAHPRLPDDESD